MGEALGDFSPTPNVPSLWSRPQYDAMPALALLLRPQVASFKQGMSVDQRADALEGALRRMLKSAAPRKQPPTRLLHSTAPGSGGAELLARALARLAPQAGLLDAGAGFWLEQCLGGGLDATSMDAAIGLASIAMWETAGSALVVNLRDPDGALVCALWPPAEEYRKSMSTHPYVI